MLPLVHRERKKIQWSGVSLAGAVPQSVTYGLAKEVQEAPV